MSYDLRFKLTTSWANPTFDQKTFSDTDYKQLYELYHKVRAFTAVVPFDGVGNAVLKYIRDNKVVELYPLYDALRNRMATNRLSVTLYPKVRYAETTKAHYRGYVWGEILHRNVNGTETIGYLILWEEHLPTRKKGMYCVVSNVDFLEEV